MTRKKDKNSLDEYRKIKDEMILDKVNEIFRKYPDNYIQKLEEIGFDLLNDLSFFHEFRNILEELVNRFLSARRQEKNLLNFSEIVQDFYYATEPDSYDALSKLKELFPTDTEKGKNIEFVAVELLKNRGESGHIEF